MRLQIYLVKRENQLSKWYRYSTINVRRTSGRTCRVVFGNVTKVAERGETKTNHTKINRVQ